MEREDRYLVIKKEDIIELLDASEKETLIYIEECIEARRGKPVNEYVVVGKDWPMYERVWQMIEDWVDNGIANAYDPSSNNWFLAEDINRMVKQLDHAMNGHDAAPQARLCDILGQLESHIRIAKHGTPRETLPTLNELDEELPWDLQLAGLMETVADEPATNLGTPSDTLNRLASAIYEAAGLQDPDINSAHFAKDQLVAHSEPSDRDVYTTQDDLFRIRLANAITRGAELGKVTKSVDLYQSDLETPRHVLITYDDGTHATLFGEIANDFFTKTGA